MDRVTFVERKLPRRVETYVERKNRGRVVAVLAFAFTAAITGEVLLSASRGKMPTR